VTAAELDRADVRARRAAWLQERDHLDPRQLVFLDETWAKTNMAPTHGRCRRGERLIARVPFGHWKTSTFLAALRWDGVSAPAVFDGPINGRSFTAYVEQILVPTLRPGDIVVLDNLGSHKGKAARDAIERAGAELRFCRPIRPTSIPSSRSSPSSRRCCDEPRPATAMRCGRASARYSTAFRPPNAETTSATPDTPRQPKWLPL
jgi:hypothetical protein